MILTSDDRMHDRVTASGRKCRASCTPVSTTSIHLRRSESNVSLTTNHHLLNVASLTTLLRQELRYIQHGFWGKRKGSKAKKEARARVRHIIFRFIVQVLINCSPTSCAECRRLKLRCDRNVKVLTAPAMRSRWALFYQTCTAELD